MGILKRGLGKMTDNSDVPKNETIDESDSSDSDSESSSDENSAAAADTSPVESDQEEEKMDEGEAAGEGETLDEDDELVKAIKAAKEKVRNHPPDIKLEECITDICFHPLNDMIAVALITGDVALYNYSNEGNTLVATHEIHERACRDIEFSEEGSILFSTSKDHNIMLTDTNTGKLKRFYEDAHEVPIYCLTILNNFTFVTGDDDGIVRLWDVRTRTSSPVFSIKLAEDYISDMITNSSHKYLVCSCGDGTLSAINMTARKIYVQTEEYESDLTCLGLYRNETKIMAGSAKGKMYIFNWGEFGLHSDEYSGLKQSITCMVPVTENIAVISGEDGVLRATHLFPHKHLGVVGQHSMPVDNMDISNDGHFIASSSHDNDIRFWNSTYFEDIEVKTKKQNRRRDLRNNLPSSKIGNSSDFFADLS
ncbi:WD repeat-containing protein 55 homolog isoform X2 [Arctopsyche grandis]